MKKLKTIGNILAISLFFGAFFCFFIFLGLRGNSRVAMPVGMVNAIFVDKKGQIYVGCVEAARIQVFDNQGNYLYSNTFHAYASFCFLVADDGVVNVVVPGDNMIYVFRGQEQLSQTSYLQESENDIVKMVENEMQAERTFTDSYDNSYYVENGKIHIKRAGTDDYSRIKFKAPIFPLSTFTCAAMFVLGGMIFVVINQKALSNL